MLGTYLCSRHHPLQWHLLHSGFNSSSIVDAMMINELSRSAIPVLRQAQPLRTVVQPTRTVLTWAEQDHWEDPRGPLGIDRPSPKLAPLTLESPQWLHDLHNNGVSIAYDIDASLSTLTDSSVGYSERGGSQGEGTQIC